MTGEVFSSDLFTASETTAFRVSQTPVDHLTLTIINLSASLNIWHLSSEGKAFQIPGKFFFISIVRYWHFFDLVLLPRPNCRPLSLALWSCNYVLEQFVFTPRFIRVQFHPSRSLHLLNMALTQTAFTLSLSICFSLHHAAGHYKARLHQKRWIFHSRMLFQVVSFLKLPASTLGQKCNCKLV